jgi:Domain of unknown function (DUF5666)
MKARNWIVRAPALFVLFLTVACSHSSSSSPTGPTSGQSGAGSSATINGSLTGASSAGLTNRVMALTSSNLIVTIAGTNVSAIVDAAGRFSLTNVPVGDVQLRFSGQGSDATLTVAGVQNGDRITLTITLNGGTASIENSLREGMERKVEVEGQVATVNCPSFTVNGVTVVTNTSTQFENGNCSTLKPGMKVEAKGTRQTDGSLLASKVEINGVQQPQPPQAQGEVELEGAVTAGTGCSSFTVRGVVVTTNASTVFRNGVCGDVKTGVKVEVKATRTNGVVLASSVSIERDDDEGDDEQGAGGLEIEGVVTTANGCASFVVNGVTITTSAATRFSGGACADIKPRVKVEVTGTRTGNGTVAASKVEIDKD